MDDIPFAYGTAAVIVGYFFLQVFTRRFDPFAPPWLFLVGYVQLYVVQAIAYHKWGVSVHGKGLVAAADWRALWALLWFFLVYHLSPGRWISAKLPQPPRSWSPSVVAFVAPPLILWGLFCAGVLIRGGDRSGEAGAETTILSNFPFVMLVAGMLLIVTGRNPQARRPVYLAFGLAVAACYGFIWMFNGKRSHSLIAILATMCAWYLTRLKRPSWPILFSTAFAGALAVAIAIGWRNDREHERSVVGFLSFIADFRVSRILESMNINDGEDEKLTYESEEWGGFLLMMDTVPEKSDYDYGANYLRVFSTFIPRLIWRDKPLFGRTEWVNAWIAGSEIERDEEFSGPAIGLLGATQLNGGAIGTAIVIAGLALLMRAAYEYLILYQEVPWVQFWWAVLYYNAWFMVVCDDPLVWFYYNWGFTAFPVVMLTWFANRSGGRTAGAVPSAIVAMT